MVKILGLPFDNYVNSQVDIRQVKLAKHQKDPDDLVVFNSNTSWVRLSSAVKIDAEKAAALNDVLEVGVSRIQGTKLAENLVLFAGITPYPSGSQGDFRGGIGYGLNNNYGFLTQTSQGLKPLPGITQISVTSKNNGSLKQAQVNIKCYSRAQFEALEAVYLRLGYTMILEWGHSVWFDNNGDRQTTTFAVMPQLLFSTDSDIKPDTALTKIARWKKDRAGNYDGMVARVSNYSWNLNNDLSFDIKLDLISVGDLIDSLKANVGATGSPVSVGVEAAPGLENIITIQVNQNTSKINKFLYELWSEIFAPLVNKYGSGDEKKAVEAANETATALTKTQQIVQDVWLPASAAIKNYAEIWRDGAQAAKQYFTTLKNQPANAPSTPIQLSPTVKLLPFTPEQTESLQKVVDFFQTAEIKQIDIANLYRSGRVKFQAPTNVREAYNLYIKSLEFQEDEITVANDFVSSVDQLERYLQNPGETLKEKAKEFNTTIEAKQARNDLIRALDRGILDKDGKLEVPAGIKFETGFDSTYFAQLLEVLLTYDKTDNIDV